jgi:iron complex outermembrane recepter protein
VNVTELPGNRVRVAVTGTDALPVAEVRSEAQGLVLAVTLGEAGATAEEEAIQVVVTGQEEGYYVPDASAATRTDTPLRDIPQAIQVIPQEVIEDQQATLLDDALRNATGVTLRSPNDGRIIFNSRGFFSSDLTGNILRNGLRDPFAAIGLDLSNIERVEVLRGPASVLYGAASPGGTVNLITKQPLTDPFYSIEGIIGNYDFYRGAVDLSGPLNGSETLLYRLNLSYTNQDLFTDFSRRENLSIAPVLSLALGENTRLTLEGDYIDLNLERSSLGVPARGTVLPNINGEFSRGLSINEGSFERQIGRIGYALEHEFSDNWSLRNAFRYGFYRTDDRFFFATALLPDDRTLERKFDSGEDQWDYYELTTNAVGRFSTGSIEHELLVGFDLSNRDDRSQSTTREAAPIDLFDPDFGESLGAITATSDTATFTDAIGIYVQDQIALADNLNLLLGLRFDAFEQTGRDYLEDTSETQSGDAFSPRLGIVYQPIPDISLYASYSRSFTPTIGRAVDGNSFQPERGTQYEVGVKADLTNRLAATLALYDLTRSNVATEDPNNPGFRIQTGEQRSQGVELTLGGEILPGWNIIAGYAYTDARITEDNTFDEGNRLYAPENAFNVWTSYQIQAGSFQGLGFGIGLFFEGERQADLANTFEIPSYLRTDAAVFYERDRFRASLNVRNLFDVDYFENAFSALRVYPGQPFTVQGSISWEF